jgi:hypothetical protein
MNSNEIYNKAVKLAASHFLSSFPKEASADDIFDALDSDKLPEGYVLWEKIEDAEEVSDLIQNLANDFISFAEDIS